MSLLKHTFEHNGVILLVTYDPEEPVTFHSIRALGADYKETGPELMPFMHDLLLMVEPLVAERLLSRIAEDIYASHTQTSRTS